MKYGCSIIREMVSIGVDGVLLHLSQGLSAAIIEELCIPQGLIESEVKHTSIRLTFRQLSPLQNDVFFRTDVCVP